MCPLLLLWDMGLYVIIIKVLICLLFCRLKMMCQWPMSTQTLVLMCLYPAYQSQYSTRRYSLLLSVRTLYCSGSEKGKRFCTARLKKTASSHWPKSPGQTLVSTHVRQKSLLVILKGLLPGMWLKWSSTSKVSSTLIQNCFPWKIINNVWIVFQQHPHLQLIWQSTHHQC